MGDKAIKKSNMRESSSSSEVVTLEKEGCWFKHHLTFGQA